MRGPYSSHFAGDYTQADVSLGKRQSRSTLKFSKWAHTSQPQGNAVSPAVAVPPNSRQQQTRPQAHHQLVNDSEKEQKFFYYWWQEEEKDDGGERRRGKRSP